VASDRNAHRSRGTWHSGRCPCPRRLHISCDLVARESSAHLVAMHDRRVILNVQRRIMGELPRFVTNHGGAMVKLRSGAHSSHGPARSRARYGACRISPKQTSTRRGDRADPCARLQAAEGAALAKRPLRRSIRERGRPVGSLAAAQLWPRRPQDCSRPRHSEASDAEVAHPLSIPWARSLTWSPESASK
jgi:hypothetical protein